MNFSIITACFNSERTIKDTLDSILEQTWKDLEIIVVDGDSNDSTCEIVQSYRDSRVKLISEKDEGIYWAMNKGIQESNGDIVGFLNSDDFFSNNLVLEKYSIEFSKGFDCCYGDIEYVTNVSRKLCKPLRLWKPGDYKEGKLQAGWIPPHPSFYAKKDLFNNLGSFDINLKFAADFDLMCRFLSSDNIKVKYLEGTKVKMRVGGITNNSIKNIYLGNKEIIASLKRNRYKPGISFFIFKMLERFTQYFRA